MLDDFHIVVIDGTGDWSDKDYAESMRYSFCHQIKLNTSERCDYLRGPSFEGYWMNSRGEWARDIVLKRYQSGTKRFFLAGYSRGAVASIMAAEYLFKVGIEVEAMFLLDPVARHASSGGVFVPSNVKNIYVARRAYTQKMVDEYDFTIGISDSWLGRLFFHNPIRTSFGFAKIIHSGATRVVEGSFYGSHGALGGVGWEHVKEDKKCELNVINFLQYAFSKHDLLIKLVMRTPMSKPNSAVAKMIESKKIK